jgi:hypothetical protein
MKSHKEEQDEVKEIEKPEINEEEDFTGVTNGQEDLEDRPGSRERIRNDKEEIWKEVRGWRKDKGRGTEGLPPRRPIARGRREETSIIQAVESKIWLHVSRLLPSTEREHMEEYLRKNGVQGNISCQEVSNRFSNKAFKIGVPLQYRETVYSEDFWPSGIKFRAFRAP